MRVVVTGGSGKCGRWVVRELRAAGYDVLNVDRMHDGSPHGQCMLADLTELGQCYEVLAGAEAVVHLAAVPASRIWPEGETFRNNTISTHNVFAVAAALGVGRVVWASSETVLGLPFDEPPAFAPIDESHPARPESSYALSKLLAEQMAEQFARRGSTVFVGLRISNIMEPSDYGAFESWQADPRQRRWNLWGYVDARDVASAVRQGLEADLRGAEVAIIAAADTCMRRPSAELMAEVYPAVELRGPLDGRQSLLAIGRAGQLLGYEPRFSWLGPEASHA